MSGKRTPFLSVVVIGRNEGESLARCLASVRSIQNASGEVELIYVDSASTDASPDIAAEAGATVIHLNAQRPTAALARNAGARAALAPIVLFLDGDTILDPQFVAQSLPSFADTKVAVICGNRRELRPEASFFNRVLDLDWMSPAGVVDYCGGDALMRRSVLEEMGGYDPGLIAGEEPDLCRRMRGKGHLVLHLDLAMTGHDLRMTRWSQYWIRAVRTGYAYAQLSARYRGTPLPLWEAEAKRNKVRGTAFLGALAMAPFAAAALPAAAFLMLLAAAFLAARSAWKMRWKSSDRWTLVLYGIHSHVQQIPILLGQWNYAWDCRTGRTRYLIEYKGPAV